jgi:hypothetical protein
LTSSTKRSLAGTCLWKLCRNTWRAVRSFSVGVVLSATVKVGDGTTHKILEMLETEMSEVLVPEQQLLLHSSEIPIGIAKDVGKHTERVVER